ncbi:MAG: AAA family ATPase [Treponema sp.]|nr:AAA family ATPase [Treponema sp.]MDY5764961.1 AAA family ATPase [Treponema sp.]
MFLKSLDIFGFKSFADRTHIDFSDGITALLGPNGCGKSNIVDAIKWVLAENKAKNLRATSKEDVIFNGTERRSPLNVAEVTLTMSNETGLLPLEESEIAIKRRLYRNGDNEYFINNKPASGRDILRLFMDTGVGKSAYSVMEQGKIDQILSSKPEDRRYLFEEAAGISKSKVECQEAERQLEIVRNNMKQIEASIVEIKKSYDTLKVQAEKTSKYRNLKEEIFNYDLDITLIKLKNFIQERARHEKELREVELKRNEVRSQIDEINNSITENTDKVKEMQEMLYSKQTEAFGLQKEKNGKLELIKKFNEDASKIKLKITQLEATLKSVQDRIDDLNQEIDENKASLHDKQKQLSDISTNIENFKENIELSSNQITENSKNIQNIKQKIQDLTEKDHTLQQNLTQITEDIVTLLDSKMNEQGFSENALKTARENLEMTVSKLKIFTEGRKNIFSDFINASSSNLEQWQKKLKEAVDAFSEANALTVSLEKSLNDFINSSPSFISDFLSPEGIMTKKRKIDSEIQDNKNEISSNSSKIEELNSENSILSTKIEEFKDTLDKLKLNKVRMQEQISSSEKQVLILQRNLSTEQNSLRGTEDQLYEENKAHEDLQEQIIDLQSELAEIEHKGQKLVEEMNSLDEKIQESNSRVSGKKDTLIRKQNEQKKYQEQFEKLSLSLAASETEIKNIKQNFQEQNSRDLMEFEEHMYKITTPIADLREKLAAAKTEFKNLGQVNLMAVEEFAEQKERYEKQKANYDDTQKSLENLIRVSEEIKAKSSEMFIETYNKIKKNFHNMFRRLFNGGRAELKLQDPQNVLTSGIDILAQPPGKKLESIGLLSGGEKTMTAVALLFATYQVRPSPFCLLDEIDAALDDKNVSSFVTALESFSKVSQYIVITHNKKTVLGAKTMLGITMEESGVSKIVQFRLDKDIKISSLTDENSEIFVEEDVPLEENAYIPPRPKPRVHNPDGTIYDPEIEKYRKELKEKELQEKKAREEAKKAAMELENKAFQEDSQNSSVSNEN